MLLKPENLSVKGDCIANALGNDVMRPHSDVLLNQELVQELITGTTIHLLGTLQASIKFAQSKNAIMHPVNFYFDPAHDRHGVEGFSESAKVAIDMINLNCEQIPMSIVNRVQRRFARNIYGTSNANPFDIFMVHDPVKHHVQDDGYCRRMSYTGTSNRYYLLYSVVIADRRKGGFYEEELIRSTCQYRELLEVGKAKNRLLHAIENLDTLEMIDKGIEATYASTIG